MAIVYVLPPAGGLQNTGYANGRTYTSNGVAIPVPDFDAAVLANAGWTVLGSVPAQLGGGGIGLKSAGVLAQSGAPSSVTGTTSETTLATVAVPANAMSVNGCLRVKLLGDVNSNGNVKTIKAYFGGTLVYSGALTSTFSVAREINIFNRGATNSQVCESSGSATGVGTAGAASTTLAIDTTQAQNILITGTLATSTDNLTLSALRVELLNL